MVCSSLARFLLLLLLTCSFSPSPALYAQVSAPIGTADHPARVSGGVMAGLLLDHKDPEYPQAAKAKHLAGAVVLRVLVTREGKVADVSALTGPEELREAASAAVHDWTYKPYQLNGKPVYVETTVTINFKPLDLPPASADHAP